jgi:hypothetical protein
MTKLPPGDPLAEGPRGPDVGDVQCAVQPANALEAQTVEHLVLALLVRQVVQPLQEHHAHQHVKQVGPRCVPAELGRLHQAHHLTLPLDSVSHNYALACCD